jgi:HAMP domain-containing protein
MRPLVRIGEKGSIARKMTINLGLILFPALAITFILLGLILNNQANQQINLKAALIMDSMLAVSEYTNDRIDPIIDPINQKSETVFLPEAIPYYSANTVYSYLIESNPEYLNYSFRQATLNPTNLKDKADSVEAAIIEEFRANPLLKEKIGNRATPTGNFFYIAKPLKISKISCLQCHSEPSKAPPGQLLTYGKSNGFGWKLGETVGALVVTIPIDVVHRHKWQSLFATLLLMSFSLLGMAIATQLTLHRQILEPIRQMSSRANQASINPESIEFHEKSRVDEIGTIARSLERMKQSLKIAMKMLRDKN